MSDQQDRYLAARVADALATDERTNELGIDVTIVAGKVHLSGAVMTGDARDALAQVASEVAGDLPVINDVTVPELPEPVTVEEL